MHIRRYAAFAVLAHCFFALCASAADPQIPVNATGPYDNIPQWLKPVAPGRYIYPLTVFAQSPDRIFIGIGGTSLPLDPNIKYDGDSWRKEYPDARADHKVFVVDRNGKVVEDWTQWDQQIQWPHRIRINPYDPEQHVWIIDRTSQQVLKFTNDGKKLVMTLGERGVAGTDTRHFGRPTDIAWLPDGTFFVTDGYDNARVMKFDKDGRFLLQWGSKGAGPGQFNLVHGLTIGPDREIYIVDRDNKRIQVFDVNGKFIRQWPVNERPTAVLVDAQKNAWVLEGNPGGKLGKHDVNGKYLHSWGTPGEFPGAMHAPHDMSVDAEGALYVSYSPAHRVDKYVPKAGADKSLLAGRRYVEKISR